MLRNLFKKKKNMNENQFERKINPSPEQEPSQKEISEKAAQEWLAKEWQERLKKQEVLLKENPVFSAKGREYPIENKIDFLVASVQTKKRLAEELLNEIREVNDYWKEKMTAKLVAFYKKEEELMLSYAEMALYYPDLSQEIEKESPYFAKVRDLAQKKFSNWSENNE